MTDWSTLWPVYLSPSGRRSGWSSATLVLGGILGLALGVLLYTTRRGGLLENRALSAVLNVRRELHPADPVHHLHDRDRAAHAAGARHVPRHAGGDLPDDDRGDVRHLAGSSSRTSSPIEPGVIEAARAMGSSPWRIITTLLIPEALGPLILGYTFIFVAIVDLSADRRQHRRRRPRRLRDLLRLPAVQLGGHLVTAVIIIVVVQARSSSATGWRARPCAGDRRQLHHLGFVGGRGYVPAMARPPSTLPPGRPPAMW